MSYQRGTVTKSYAETLIGTEYDVLVVVGEDEEVNAFLCWLLAYESRRQWPRGTFWCVIVIVRFVVRYGCNVICNDIDVMLDRVFCRVGFEIMRMILCLKINCPWCFVSESPRARKKCDFFSVGFDITFSIAQRKHCELSTLWKPLGNISGLFSRQGTIEMLQL